LVIEGYLAYPRRSGLAAKRGRQGEGERGSGKKLDAGAFSTDEGLKEGIPKS
jgi:hypothetical protein